MMDSVRKVLRVCMSVGTAQTCAGALSCAWHPAEQHVLLMVETTSVQHPAPRGSGVGMVNDAKGSSGLGRPSLLCLQGCCARHFSTSSLRPDATREQLGKGPRTPASWSRPPGGSAPRGHILSRLGMGLCARPAGGGRHERVGGQRTSADLLLSNMSLAAGDPHAADLEDTSAVWCRWPELALPDLLLLKPAAPFLARLRDVGADTQF